MAILQNIQTNSTLQFAYQNYSFYVHPYGVVTLDDAKSASATSKECRQIIEKFYIAHPQEYYFADSALHVKQLYHIENMKNNEFVVYAKGEVSYSELLLKNGLAIVGDENALDKRYRFRFLKAQKIAKRAKRGLFSDTKLQNCVRQF